MTGKIRPEQLGTAAAITALLNAADAAAARTALGVPALAGDTFTGPIALPGVVFGVGKANTGGAAANYQLATLKASNDGGSNSRMAIHGMLDDTWFSNGQTPFHLYIGTRGALSAQMVLYGAPRTNARVVVYQEADNTYTVWLHLPAGTYSSASLMIHAGHSCAVYRDTPAGTPTGTLVYTTADTATYPPVAVLNFAADMRAFLACTNDAAARAELGLGALATKSTVGYADLAISIGGRNLLANSSFEQGLTGWTPSVVTATVSSTQALVGTLSARLTVATAAYNTYLLGTCPVKPLTTYTVSAWLYVESITGDAYSGRELVVIDAADIYNAAGVTGGLTTSHPVGVWARKIVRITTTAACTSLNIRLYCPTGVVHWDCVQVEEGDMPTAWSPFVPLTSENRIEEGLGGLSVLDDVAPDGVTRAAPADNTTWFEYEEGMGQGFISLVGPGHVGSGYEQNVRVCAQIGGVKYSNILQRA